MTEVSAHSKTKQTLEIVVTRSDGTVQNYGVVPGEDAGIRERWRFVRRARRLNAEAHRANPEVPTTSVWEVIRYSLFGGN